MLIGRLSQMSPPPCLYDTVIQSYVQLKSGSIERTAHFMGRPTPLKVNGANFSTLLPPRGATFTPFWGMVLQSLPASSNVANFTFLWNPLSELRGVKSFSQCKVNGATLGRSCPPGVQLLPHFEVWSYRACQPLEMWQISHFCEIHSLSYEASKFFSMLSLCVFFCPYFAPGANIVPRSLIKVIAHDSRLGRTFWHLIHGSVTKTVGGVARRNKSGRRRRRRIISMSNNNTVLCH